MPRTLVLALAVLLAGPALAAMPLSLTGESSAGPVAFARAEIERAAAASPDTAALAVSFEISPASAPSALPAQAYRVELPAPGRVRIVGGDATGAMYGGLDVAEAIRHRTIDRLRPATHTPHVVNRGLKLNVPLDLRTPSYTDCSDASQANIPEMWSEVFWRTTFDEMARDRYNVLSLWSLHAFPSLVKVPEFPDVALDDVWRTRAKLDDTFSHAGNDMVRPAMLADHEVVKKITIDEKIAFWRRVMELARDRGIAIYLFHWNIFTWGADGKHGITRDIENPVTKAYFRASVREMVKTYPLLAGFGITAGEGMPAKLDPKIKEQWLWDTYGEGVRDALQSDPTRVVRMIHRFHWTAQNEIIAAWKNYPGYPTTFDFSFKYSVAHMYSIPNPPFIQALLEHLAPGLRTWLTVRNDDIYTFRFGDPAYARDYITHMPPAEKLGGFYMGPDGYFLGRDFLDREAPATVPRPLVMEKQWYSFMQWGRLAYDPTLPDALFERALATRFSTADAPALFTALQSASQTMPLITRFFWGDIDLKWFPEACLSHPRAKGFYTVRHFIEGVTMPGAGVLDIREWRAKRVAGVPMTGTTPPEIAAALEASSTAVFASLAKLRTSPLAERELRKTLDDCEALALLARYYAAKIRGACALALFDHTADPAVQAGALQHLSTALSHWKAYATLRDSHYLPALYNRVGYVDLTALTAKVAADVEIARAWKPGSVGNSGPRAGTEKGFKP